MLADPTRLRQISERIPAGRWGDPKDFAGPTVFLASAASAYVSGELLVVDGVRLILTFFEFESPSEYGLIRCFSAQGWMGR